MSLFFRLCGVLLLWGYLVTSNVAMDFDDSDTIAGWDFIYHQHHDLLLTVAPDSCYFSVFQDRYANRTLSVNNRQRTENLLYRLTQTSGTPRIVPSTLTAQRAKFHDILANYQCVGKHIYQLPLKGDDFIRAGIIHSYVE